MKQLGHRKRKIAERRHMTAMLHAEVAMAREEHPEAPRADVIGLAVARLMLRTGVVPTMEHAVAAARAWLATPPGQTVADRLGRDWPERSVA